MSWFELIADRKIRDAQEEGKFDNLPGRGRPLQLEIDSRVPPEQRAAYRLMKEANLLPDWIELDKQIRRRQERIAARVEEYARRREPDLARAGRDREHVVRLDARRDDFLIHTARELRDLNRGIDRLNLIVPAVSRQRLRLNLAEQVTRLEEQFPRLQPRADGQAPWRELTREERPPTRLGQRMPVRRKRESIG